MGFHGAPGRIRTSGRLIRSQVLYPAELLARWRAAHRQTVATWQHLIGHSGEESAGKRDIERGFVEPIDFSGGEPTHRPAFARMRLALPPAAGVKEDYNLPTALPRRFLREHGRFEIGGSDRDAEFFLQFPQQRRRRRFARFDLAAGKFPQSAMMLASGPPVHEPPPPAVVERDGDDRQPCRVIFQFTNSAQLFLKTCPTKSELSATN